MSHSILHKNIFVIMNNPGRLFLVKIINKSFNKEFVPWNAYWRLRTLCYTNTPINISIGLREESNGRSKVEEWSLDFISKADRLMFITLEVFLLRKGNWLILCRLETANNISSNYIHYRRWFKAEIIIINYKILS